MKLLITLQNKVPSIATNEQGATMVEYAIMVALIATVSFLIVTGFGRELSTTFGTASNSLVKMNG